MEALCERLTLMRATKRSALGYDGSYDAVERERSVQVDPFGCDISAFALDFSFLS
ncbi:hypothetical protein SAMCFNEI73_pC1797 (plasmid) [Sinorhizobium americanum]|uniref:Uncharacterized protein n=1 Tax=Sinorhizobium americanum TaxID=194963 RepID=A0A1L3LZK1_9HYPH|nr:hypothetical protein SAMCFNEI73_pC1797 [Sinorhizobium americanum]